MKTSLGIVGLVIGASLAGFACGGSDAHVVRHGNGAAPGGNADSPPVSGTPSTPGAPSGESGTGTGTGTGTDEMPWPGSQVVFLPFGAQRTRTDASWGSVLTDLAQHVPAMYGTEYDEPGDFIAWGEIATIGTDSYLRNYVNPYGGSGKASNGFYVTKDRMAFVLEPSLTLSKVLMYIPASLRGPSFDSELANAVADWDDAPSYVLDEWITLTNGSAVAVELGKAGSWTTPRDAMTPTFEFMLYGLALAAATEANDGSYFASEIQLRELVAWNAERSQGLCHDAAALPIFASTAGDALRTAWKTSPDAAGLRNFARRVYRTKYVTQILEIDATPE